MKELEELEFEATRDCVLGKSMNPKTAKAVLSLIRELKITRRALKNASKVQHRSLLLNDEVYEQRDSAQVAYNLRLAARELYPETEQP